MLVAEKGKEVAGLLWNITGTLCPNINVSIKSWLIIMFSN
jgi:hypothetical protein